MLYRIDHETRLEFPAPVHEHHCELRVAPRQDSEQKLVTHTITLDPPADILTYTDSFGNRVAHFTVMAPHQHLTTRVISEVETRMENPFAYPLLMPEEESPWYAEQVKKDPLLWPYILYQSASTPAWKALNESDLTPPVWDRTQPVQVSVLKAMRWIGELLRYQPGTTTVDTPLADVLNARAGVCQDFAHAFISLLRSWGLPARYVMGYLDPGLAAEEPLINGEQASHAWVEVLIPGAGWRGFDATHQLVADQTYIPVAVGRDAHDAAPQRGSFKGGHAGHSPRITLRVARQNQ